MTFYKRIRIFLAGKRIYSARKVDKEGRMLYRVFYASSFKQAQAKYLKWDIKRGKK